MVVKETRSKSTFLRYQCVGKNTKMVEMAKENAQNVFKNGS